MSAIIIGGVNSIVVNIATPYETDGKTVRDDLAGIRVWYSTTKGFLPPLQGQLAYDGPGLSIAIPLSDAESKLTYYVRYSLISDIDPTVVDISDEYTVIPKNINALDFTAPDIPANPNIKVTSGFSFIYVSQDAPSYTTGHGHLKARVYALNKTLYPSKNVEFANATLQVEFTGTIGSFNSDPNTQWAVWVTWVSVDGAQANPIIESQPAGPFLAATAQDVTQLVNAVVNGTGSPFKVIDKGYTENPGTKDQFYVPPGVYAKAAFITDGFITNVKIADGTIDSAKINNLDAIHLTAGDGTLGGVLKSANYNYLVDSNGRPYRGVNQRGWAIFPDGSVDFAAADIRGQLTAQQIDATGLSIRRKNDDGSYTTILDAGLSIQQQINNYAVNATAGITLNFDPTCSNTTAWDARNIATITDGLTGNKVLAGSNGEHLFEGITINKAYTINYDPQKRYQISALIRRTSAATSGDVHLGLLEVDANNAARYDWGGYLTNKIPVNSLTTSFKRYYGYFAPGDLHTGTSKVIVHTILGYPNTGGGRVEIQDIKLEDISQGHAVQYASTTTAAVDATNKSTATLNTAQSNMGINSWIINRYAVTTTTGTIPDYTLFANVTPVQTVTFTDTVNLNGSTIFGNNYDNYIGVATCNVYCETATTWTTTISGDDGHNLYVNGISVIKSGVTRGATPVTINFPKGWSTIEAVWCEQSGSDGFTFGNKISSAAGVSQMWAFVGGTSATNGIAASAATTSTWAGTTDIPYDKIVSTDATTTLGFNPSFELWTGIYPANWNYWSGTAPIKESTITRFGTNAVKYTANGEDGLGIQHAATWSSGMPIGSFISGTIDINLVAVTSGLPGIIVRLFNKSDLTTFVDTLVQPVNIINTWQRLPFTARVGVTEQIYGVQVYLAGSWAGFTSGVFKGTVVFDGLTFAFFDSSVDNKNITVTDGKLTGIGVGINTVVDNTKITVTDGKLTGIGAGINTVVDNTKITVTGTGTLSGIGTNNVVVDNSKVLVGGTNLIRNSGNFIDTSNWVSLGGTVSISSTIKYGTKNTLQIIGNSSGGATNSVIMQLKPNTQYTVSAIVKADKIIAAGPNTVLNILNSITEDPTYTSPTILTGDGDTRVTTEWKQIYQTFTTLASANPVNCKFSFSSIINAQLNIVYVQLEQGNKVSDWSPCPDDIDALISTTVKGNANDFISKKAANVLDATLNGGFTIQTPNYAAGNGLVISSTGIAAKRNGLDTFVIDNYGDATFRGTVIASMMKSNDGNFVIDLGNKYISISV
jgi:hypothetical protein